MDHSISGNRLFGGHTKTLRTLLTLAIAGLLFYSLYLQAAENNESPEKVIWEKWYTIHTRQIIPYAYYREKLALKDDRYHLQYEMVKKEEDGLLRENYGAFIQNNSALTPQAFNIVKSYKNSSEEFDGTLDPKKNTLSMKRQLNGRKERPLKKTLNRQAFLSSAFALWLNRHLSTLTDSKTQQKILTFVTLLEENLESVSGTVRLLEPDTYAKKNSLHVLEVSLRGIESRWWVNPDGSMKKMVRMDQGQITEESSADKAITFLE